MPDQKKDSDSDKGASIVKAAVARPVTDADLKDMELQLQGIDASYRGKADTNIDVAKGKRLKMILLENMVRRLQAERRTAKAWHLQRQVYKIEREGRVLTALQRQMDEVNDIEAERAALREDERRKERE